MLRVVAALCCVLVALARPLADDVSQFAMFRSTFGRQYSASEESARFKCFQQNLDEIDRLNGLGDHALYGINKFADMCADEFKMYHNMATPTNKTYNYARMYSAAEIQAAPTSVDWRTKNVVTPVKDQAQCGSCWAFSSTGNMEGQNALATGKLLSLSEEELVQCSKNGGNAGCNGGLMDNAFTWVVQNGGIDSEQDYPYTSGMGKTGKCNTAKEKSVVAKFSSHVDMQHSEDQIAAYLAQNGPVAIGVDAESGWQTYQGGIMSTCKGKQLDHGVLLVGYGVDNGKSYWIVKNSWGPSWGENGYIRLARGNDPCGMTQQASSIKV